MRTLLIGLLLLAPALTARADDTKSTKPPAGESFATVKKAWEDARDKNRAEFMAAREAAKKQGEAALKAFKFDKPFPTATLSARFLAVAERDPEGPDAIDALAMTLMTSYDFVLKKTVDTKDKALKILHDHHVTNPKIKSLTFRLISLDDDDFARKLVDDIIAKNPDRQVRFVATRTRLERVEGNIEFADRIKKYPQVREAVEAREGKSQVAERLAKAEKSKGEIEAMKAAFREEYADLLLDLSVGKPAPEVISRDLDGKTVKLSDLKGKVVVLDIWATWCGPCKAMIPHEREMVGRLTDKPFRLVSISIDEKVETLKEFLAKEPMPWTHWFEGQEGIGEKWNIGSVPAIFVLDASGVIRHRDIRDKELETAVNAILKEMEPKKTAAQ